MLERFNQFDRQDNPKKIAEGIADMEGAVPNTKSPKTADVPVADVEAPDARERIAVTDEERAALFSRLETPRDILTLPTPLRRDGTRFLREKIAERYLSISRIQETVFDRIEELDAKGTIDTEALKREIEDQADTYGFATGDREIISKLFSRFCEKYDKLQEIRNAPKKDLLWRFAENPALLSSIKSEYHVKITPFSVHFDFDDVADFRSFVSENEGQAREEYKHTYGLSYYKRGYPITAAGYKPTLDVTSRHEKQHKKFSTVAFDRILLDEKTERESRDEMLASFAGREEAFALFDHVLSYEFSKEKGDKHDRYKKMLRDAVTAIQELQYMHFSTKEIIGLLSKEKLTTWPKIVKRLATSKTGQELILQRKRNGPP